MSGTSAGQSSNQIIPQTPSVKLSGTLQYLKLPGRVGCLAFGDLFTSLLWTPGRPRWGGVAIGSSTVEALYHYGAVRGVEHL